MKQFLVSAWLGFLSVMTASAATSPIFINDSAIVSPPVETPAIDATAWVNRSVFNITAVNGSGVPLPFESQNTLFFTNTPGGVMFGNPGFRWFYNVGTEKLWMDTWTNQGPISADAAFSGLGFFGGLANSQASVLMVHSANIASTAPLHAGA